MRTRTVPILLVLLVAFTACSGTARLKTIRATYDVTNVATEKLASYSAAHEAKLLAAATDAAVFDAQLAAWRAKVDHAEKAREAVYRAIATAALLNDDRSLGALIRAALILRTELQALGVAP